MSFEDLGLSAPLLQAITELGFVSPMPVQEAVIPHQLTSEQDLVALAQTGTGKTAAYGLPLLEKLANELNLRITAEDSMSTDMESKDTNKQGAEKNVNGGSALPYAIILSPTRELCIQIADDLEGFSKHLPEVRILPVYGGTNIEPQIRALRHGIHIIVATPGRLIDLMHRGAARLDRVRTVILDEADEMLSMGFSESIDAILEGVPATHTTLLFSATMSKEIERIAKNYLHDAREIVVGSRNEGAEHVNHIYYMVRASDKYLALKRVVDYYPKIYAIIFCRTRLETQEIADKLIQDGYNADALHGDLSQQQRDLTMQRFRQHRVQLLVATDVAARGLDVDDLTHVINYGMPEDIENYTHRSGRTGRAGKKGTSICIVHQRERGRIRDVEHTIKKDFVHGILPSPKEICSKQLWKVIDDIERVEVDEDEIADFLPEVRRKLEWLDKDDLLKRVVSREFSRFLRYYASAPEIEEVDPNAKEKKSKDAEGRKGTRKGRRAEGDHAPEEGYARIFITLGKVDGFYAREIIGLVNNRCQGPKIEMGRIDLRPTFSFFEVPEEEADRVLKGLKGFTYKGRRIGVDIAETPASEKETTQQRPKNRAQRRFEKAQEKAGKKGGGRRKESANSSKGDAGRGKKKDDWRQFFKSDDRT
ncbi:MAG: DEAD/DEAH box helicase [Bacteroidales bacterium]|nr:DEAD/DEAH box helicase [Bacteroidales bacterium]